ncbi:hypothetical protein LC609_13995 [Nostoc sp. XA013]|nr:hypothetical protein [Nostoc sp. XA013]
MNSNVRDPRVNDGEWKAIARPLNLELHALRCNNRDLKAIAFFQSYLSCGCNTR